MPTPEEIKKLSDAYAEYMCPVGDYCGGVYDDQRNADLPIYKDDAKSVLEWLSKDYCIVPKSKVIGLWNEINNDAKINIENGFPDYAEFNKLQLPPLEILFGKELFNEEKG